MIEAIVPFVHQLLIFGGFRVSEFPTKVYRELLTAFEKMVFGHIVMLSGAIEFAKACPGYIAIDDTSNPKYAFLKRATRKMFLTKTGGYTNGYKIVLFLWVIPGGYRIPIGFAMWDRNSPKLTELALEGLSVLRNRYKLKPLGVLGDGGYSSDEILKRIDDYGWPLVMRFKNDRVLSGISIRRLIPRGYGETEGYLKNGTKLKVIRRQKHFLCCNRMMWPSEIIRQVYKFRWKVEEVFRGVKTIIGLDGCQQHSMKAQAVFIFLCFTLFTCLETVSGGSPYKTWHQVNFGQLDPQDLMSHMLSMTF